MANACREITWILNLLRDLNETYKGPALLYCDNQAALHIAANQVYHEQTKHIELDCHFVREKLQNDALKTMHVSTMNQFAC